MAFTSANLNCLRVTCECNAPCARCMEIRTEAARFAHYTLGKPVVTFGADITKAVNDAAAAEMTRRAELESAVASNDVSTQEADAKQREIARKDVFSADDAAQLTQLQDLKDSYAAINEGLKKKAALADTEAHRALLTLVLGLLRAQFVPEPVTNSAPATPSGKKVKKVKVKPEDDALIAEATEQAAAEKREQEATERAKEAKRHALVEAEVQKAEQFAKAQAEKRAAEVTNVISVASSLVEDELQKQGPPSRQQSSSKPALCSPRPSGRRRWRTERNCPRHQPRVRLLWTSSLPAIP